MHLAGKSTIIRYFVYISHTVMLCTGNFDTMKNKMYVPRPWTEKQKLFSLKNVRTEQSLRIRASSFCRQTNTTKKVCKYLIIHFTCIFNNVEHIRNGITAINVINIAESARQMDCLLWHDSTFWIESKLSQQSNVIRCGHFSVKEEGIRYFKKSCYTECVFYWMTKISLSASERMVCPFVPEFGAKL